MRLAITLLLVALFSSGLSAQSISPTLDTVLYDANGKLVGGLILDGRVRLRLGDGRSVIVPLVKNLSNWEWPAPILIGFTGAACTGSPIMSAVYLSSTGATPFEIGGDNVLYIPDLTTYGNQATISTLNGAICADHSTINFNGYVAAAYIDLDSVFSEPFTVTPPALLTPSFTDVPVGSPYYPFIELLKNAGITQGCGGNQFCPGSSITREQMAVFIAVGLGLR